MTDRIATASSLARGSTSLVSFTDASLSNSSTCKTLHFSIAASMSCTTSGSLAGESHFEDAVLISSFTSDIGGRTLAVASLDDDGLALSSFASSATSSCVRSSSSIIFKKSSLVASASTRPLFRADALTPSSARASVTGVFGMDFARLCASNLDRALLTRENAASVARPISSSATTSGTLVPRVFAIGDERADCDIAPFGDLRARSTRPLDRAHRRLRASSSAFARSNSRSARWDRYSKPVGKMHNARSARTRCSRTKSLRASLSGFST